MCETYAKTQTKDSRQINFIHFVLSDLKTSAAAPAPSIAAPTAAENARGEMKVRANKHRLRCVDENDGFVVTLQSASMVE